MSPRERNIPSGTSPLAGQPPTLTPNMGPLKVGGRMGDEPDGQERESNGEEAEHGAAPRPPRRPGRSRGGRRPAPAVADAVPTTVRFDPEEAGEVDRFVLDLRDDAGRKRLDKAEVIREVLRLAREHDPTRRALLRRLRN